MDEAPDGYGETATPKTEIVRSLAEDRDAAVRGERFHLAPPIVDERALKRFRWVMVPQD